MVKIIMRDHNPPRPVEVDEALAARLVAGGHARYAEPETATAPDAPEKAMQPAAKRRKGGR